MTLGENIQAARKNKGYSQESLAEQVGVSRQALGKWGKDTALPGLDNLQALAAALDVSVDSLLGTAQPGGVPEPTLTLDTLRALLDARDAEKRRRSWIWGGAAAGAVLLLVAGLIGVAWQYDRQVQVLQAGYNGMQAQFSRTQSELTAQIEELQAAVRQGEATVLNWDWQPTGRVVHDLDGSWVPVSVAVTPRTDSDGMTGQLVLVHRGGRYDGTTELLDMTPGADGVYRVNVGIVFTVGETVDLSVRWKSAAGTVTNEPLGTVDCTEDTFRPFFAWSSLSDGFAYGYCTRKEGSATMLTLTSYPVELEVNVPAWMEVQSVEVELRLDGAAGEPAATATLDCLGWSEAGDRRTAVYNGTFYDETSEDGWPYQGGTVDFVARLTDTNGNVWTDTRPLPER